MVEKWMSLDMLQTVSIVLQAITAFILLFVTFSFNKRMKDIENARWKNEQEKGVYNRNALRVEYILKFEDYIEQVKASQHNLSLKYKREVKGYLDFMVQDEFFAEVIALHEKDEIDNNKILSIFGKHFTPKPWDEITPEVDEEGNPTFFDPFKVAFMLRKKIKKDNLKLEVQTLINSRAYLEPIKDIEEELEKSTAMAGHPIIDLTNNYLALEKVKKQMKFIHDGLKRDIER